MIIAVVTFNIDKELTSSLLKEKFLETSPIYKDTPGLIRKNYICDTSNNLAGGVYCFDNIENAKSLLMKIGLNRLQIGIHLLK